MKGRARNHSKQRTPSHEEQPRPPFRHRYGALFVAVLIAVGAFVLRYDLSQVIPVGANLDESIITRLADRATSEGQISANWAGFKNAWWAKSTYQFSPYTLVQECVSLTLFKLTGWPNSMQSHLVLARTMSCLFGALTVLLVFFAAKELFGHTWSAILCELTLAIAFLHVLDCSYARVEGFLGLLIVLCLYFSAKSLSTSRSKGWSYATAFVAGVAISAKYNALPVLVFVAFAGFYSMESSQRRLNSMMMAIIKYGLMVLLGFVVATPEILVDPRPLVDGALWELDHYAKGHIPFQAYDLWDNNLFYYSRYLIQLGLGVVSCLLALGFLVLTWRIRSVPMLMLSTFLCLAFVLTILPTVRFERNLEILLGPLAIAIGTTAGAIVSWVRHRYSKQMGGLVAVGMVMGIVAQPALGVFRIRNAVPWEVSPQAKFLAASQQTGIGLQVNLMTDPPKEDDRNRDQVVVADWGDRFSAAQSSAWEEQYSQYDRTEFRSVWSQYGYPFSTVDVFHGPTRFIVFTRPESPANPKQSPVEKPE